MVATPCLLVWLTQQRTAKIGHKLIILLLVNDVHFFHNEKQDDHLANDDRFRDDCSHVFLLDTRGGLRCCGAILDHVPERVLEAIAQSVS